MKEYYGGGKAGAVLRQKLSVTLVPVTQVVYWHPENEEQRSFWIVGKERRIHCKGFPKSVLGRMGKGKRQVPVLPPGVTEVEYWKKKALRSGEFFRKAPGLAKWWESVTLMILDSELLVVGLAVLTSAIKGISFEDLKPPASGDSREKAITWKPIKVKNNKNHPYNAQEALKKLEADEFNATELAIATKKKTYLFFLPKNLGDMRVWCMDLQRAVRAFENPAGKP
jgi:hypothetical protein